MVKKASTTPRASTTKTKKVVTSKPTVSSKPLTTTKPKKSLTEIIIIALIIIVAGISTYFFAKNIKTTDYVVETNAFFAPFEFYDGREIKGVDVEIINKVAEKMDKTIAIKDVEFDVIIDNVEAGKIADAGAAGLTITEARSKKVNFSIPYYSSVQYAIYNKSHKTHGDHITWDELAGKTLGSQTGGTGYLFVQDEIENGVLAGSNTTNKGFESHQLAADAILSDIIDYAIVDELPAKYMVSKNPNLAAAPLYYKDGTLTEESYAIAVNKNQPELLEAFNEVLTEMLTKDETGESELDRLVLKYMGF